MTRTRITFFAFVLFALGCAAQEQETNIGPTLPATLDGAATQLKFAPEKAQNLLRGGVSVEGTCDNNPLLEVHSTTADCFLSFMPTIAMHRTSPISKLDLSYSPGYSLHNHLSGYDSFTQNGGIDFAYRFNPNWNIRLRDNFSMTSGLNDLGSQSGQGGAFGPIEQPNSVLITPISNQFLNTAGLDIGYQFTRRSGLGVGVTYSNLQYEDAGNTNSNLVGTQTGSASAFYSYRLSPRQTIGLTYMFQRLWFDPGAPATIQSGAFSHALALTPYTTISLFIGPQYVVTNGITFFDGATVVTLPVHRESWSPLAGATLSVRRSRTAFLATFTRRVSDGGGVYGASTVTSGDVSVSQRLTRNWTVYANGGYGETELANAELTLPTKTWNAGGGVRRPLGRNFSADLNYSWQSQDSPVNNSLYAYRNRVAITLSYLFSKPLGR